MLNVIKYITSKEIDESLKNNTVIKRECPTVFGETVELSIIPEKIDNDIVLNVLGKYGNLDNFTAKWSQSKKEFLNINYDINMVNFEKESEIDTQTFLNTMGPTAVLDVLFNIRRELSVFSISDYESEIGYDEDHDNENKIVRLTVDLPYYISENSSKLRVENEEGTTSYRFYGYMDTAIQKIVDEEEMLDYLSKIFTKMRLLEDMSFIGKVRFEMTNDELMNKDTVFQLRKLTTTYYGGAVSDEYLVNQELHRSISLIMGYIYNELYGLNIEHYFAMMCREQDKFEFHSVTEIIEGFVMYNELAVKLNDGTYIFANGIDEYDDVGEFTLHKILYGECPVKEIEEEEYELKFKENSEIECSE